MAGAARVERPFIGRAEALDAIRRRSDGVRSGRGGLTVIEGEPGVGKTILVEGLAKEAQSKGVRVIVARAPALDNPPPYLLLQLALEGSGTEETSPGRPPTSTGLAFAPTALLPEPLFGPDISEHRAESWLAQDPLLDPILAGPDVGAPGRRRIDQQFVSELIAEGDRRPTILVLEDLQFADEASLDAMAHLAPQLPTHALWVVLTRVPLERLAGPRRARLEAIERAGDAEVVPVRPFTPGEATEFVHQLEVGERFPEEEIIRWHSQSRGNPSFLEQLVRRRGELAARGPSEGLGAAGEFSEYMARQMADLPPAQERVLAVGAVLGREFSFALLLNASELEEERLAEVVQELVTRGILREKPEEILEFPRDDLRGLVYQRLTEARRRLLHRRVAEAIEKHSPATPATIYALARHYYLGKVDDRTVAYNRLAAEFAARSFAPVVARQHLERARECLPRLRPPDPTAELETALELAVQLDLLGELDAAERALVGALAASEAAPDVSPALRSVARVALARIYSDQGRWQKVDEITTELLKPGGPKLSPRTLLGLHRLRGEFLYYHGRYLESLQEHDLALAIAQTVHDEREVALETVRRANVLGMIPSRYEEAVADYRRVIKTLIGRGDRSEAAFALLFLGVVLSQYGRVEEGLVALEEARRLAEEAHDPRRLGWALFDIADLERERGNLPAATRANEQAREILERIGDRYGLIQVEIIEGKIRLLTGELDRAQAELLEAYRLVRELHVPADEAEVLLRLAELALARSDAGQLAIRMAALEGLEVERLRPDLAEEFRKLKERVAPGGGHTE